MPTSKRQVFLLHRDRRSRPVLNWPPYWDGQPLDPESLLLGAVPCVPFEEGRTPENLARVLDRFLENYGVM